MIQYSFSPNWYRPQCLSFSHVENTLFYCSNCIIYKYDLKQKTIQSQLNLKDYLFKKQGYNMSSFTKQNTLKPASIGHSQQRQKSVDKQKESIEKEKILKISAMELIQGGRNLLVVGFNCIGIILVIEINKMGQMLIVRQVIDISKQTGSLFNGTQFIYVCDEVDKFGENKMFSQGNQEIKVVIFSTEGFKVNLSITLESLNDQFQQPKLKFKLISFQHIQDHKQKTTRSVHIKSISQERNLIKTEQEEMNKKKQSFCFYAVILDNSVQINQKNCNLLIYDQFFQKILIHSSINQLAKLKLIKQDSHSKEGQKQGFKQEIINQAVISADFIHKVNTESDLKYIVLTKNPSDKSNLFCQKLYMHWFDSSSLVQLLQANESSKISQDKDNRNESQQMNPQKEKLKYNKLCIEMIYPKKCHHKLVQQQKSATCIKLINNDSILLTGKLGEMMILNLKQIQLKLINSPNFVLSIRPYSYEEEKNPFWFIQPSQKHYKDIYAIYRVQRKRNPSNKVEAHQAPKDQLIEKSSQDVQRQLYLIGTDHILTSWKVSKTQQDKIDENILSYKSNIKFLTSSVEQIVLSQLQPSLVFLRLKDSNIRSFQPFSDRGYWLNEFWKHTANSFSKEIQKMVMHPVEIGVAVMVSKEGKIVLYDLYEERLIKVIEVKEKVKFKAQSGVKQGKMKLNDREGGKSKDKRSTGNPNNSLEKGAIDIKPLQINSISFEHVSVIQSIQSLFQLQQCSEISFSHQSMAELFEFRCQSFYQRQLDCSTVILIQSNEVIVIIEGLQKEYKLMRFMVLKKVFKLQRIYKTKYWNRDMLVGTRKRKGELIVGISVNVFGQSKCGVKGQGLYKGIEKIVSLTLGNSARYIFKLSSGVYGQSQNNVDKEKSVTKREYMLSVVSYKGNKLAISLFRVIVKSKSTFSIQENKSYPQLNVVQIFSSDEIQIPNLSSNNNPINIEHLVVSQQDNQYLIGVYNNQLEVINVIDYAPMIEGIIYAQKQEKEKCKQSREKEQVGNQSIDKEVIIATEQNREERNQRETKPKDQDQRKHQECLEQSNKDENIQNSIQKQQNPKRNFSDLNQQAPKQNTSSNNYNQILFKQSIDLPINLIQFSDLSYKIESILFNSVSAPNISINEKEEKQFNGNCRNNSHLIILGKDQSVRLLELNSYISHNENKEHQVLSKEQNKQRGSTSNTPFKIISKTITVRGQATSQSTQLQNQ